jgi:hypothetical protein
VKPSSTGDTAVGSQYNSGIKQGRGACDRGAKRGWNIDANRILTDLLVNFRRIVHRGLVNYSGDLWYREGLPSDVFRRLVVRKENETPLDRFSGDYEELMTYANFRDLADIIVGNEALRQRLTILEPKDGESLLDRLHELEEIRRATATNKRAGADELARLERYFDEFRTAIKRARQPADEPPGRARPASAGPPVGVAAEETLDSIFDEEAPPPAKTRPGRLVVKISSAGKRSSAKGGDARPKPAPTPQAPPVTVASTVGLETPVTEVSTRPGPTDREPLGPVEEAEGLELALHDGDDAAILRALHIEVTEIADGMLRREPKQGHPVWEGVHRRGWFASHRGEYELDPLEAFYRLADDFLEAYSSGAKSSDLKAKLAEASFSKMLLEMREMFLKSRARA